MTDEELKTKLLENISELMDQLEECDGYLEVGGDVDRFLLQAFEAVKDAHDYLHDTVNDRGLPSD